MTTKSSGFSLVELLVVVAILGILSAVATISYNGYVAGTKKTATKSYMQQVSLAQTEEIIFSCPHKNPSVKKRLGEYFHKICSAWRKYVAENT